MLDKDLLESVKEIFRPLQSQYLLDVYVDENHPSRSSLLELLEGVASCSDKITISVSIAENLSFNIVKNQVATGIWFRCVPTGHEFSSLLLALLNCDGKGANLPDSLTLSRIMALRGKIKLSTYISLSCTNCPDVVQALNLFAIYNSEVTHEIVDGQIYPQIVEELGIGSVPALFTQNHLLSLGRVTINELLFKLEQFFGTVGGGEESPTLEYDVVVAGGGPAGATAAIYLARKSMKVAMVAERVGGQVNETSIIENISSQIETSGTQFSQDLRLHVDRYGVGIYENVDIELVKEEQEGEFVTQLRGSYKLRSKNIVVATGAKWRRLGIEGEDKYMGFGVAFCPHCDGPFYKDKRIVVVGGGNSAVEAALDLSVIAKSVVLIEIAPHLKADGVLVEKLKNSSNIDFYTNTQTLKIVGDGKKVLGIDVKNLTSQESQRIECSGVFIQIGLTPNSLIVADLVERNVAGEIVVDKFCRTSKKGIYAAGDVTDVPYKQIVVAMGEGAKAALSLHNDFLATNDN